MTVTSNQSLYYLIGANLLPLFGVIYLGWDLFSIMFLYWLESAVIGAYNILRLVKINHTASLVYVPFFIVHFGIFMFIHLIFITTIFARHTTFSTILPTLWLALVALIISHGLSYYSNFIKRQEYLKRTIKQQFFAPYKRVVIMHLTILFGGGVSLILGTPLAAIIILIALKIALDSWAHLRSHRFAT